MAVLKNRTQSNFTLISNQMFHDKKLSMRDRGIISMLSSLPDGWEFSIEGLSALSEDGKDSIRKSVKKLEKAGYLKRTMKRGKDGRYSTEIEVFADRSTVADLPPRTDRRGSTVTVNPTEISIDNKELKLSTDNLSIYQKMDRETEINNYKELIAENIKMDWLIDVAKRHVADEVTMVHEIYDVICDMVCYQHNDIEIKGAIYPWTTVKSQFLKLRYEHVADVLNRIVDADLQIKKMDSYLVSTLYTASLTGTIEAQARLHDDYLKFLRGNPYG